MDNSDRTPRSTPGGTPKGEPSPLDTSSGHDPTGGPGHQAGARGQSCDTGLSASSGSSSQGAGTPGSRPGSSSPGSGMKGSSGASNWSGSSGGQGSGMEGAKQQARDTANQAKQRASEIAGAAGERTRDLGRQVSEQASEAGRKLREYGSGVLSEQKERAASELDHVSEAIHSAGDRLQDEKDDAIAGYVHALGDQVDRVSGYMKNRDLGSMAGDLRQLARRHPEWFLGGAFLAGLAIARFAKAHEPRYEGGQWRGSEGSAGSEGGWHPNDQASQPSGESHLYGSSGQAPGTTQMPEV